MAPSECGALPWRCCSPSCSGRAPGHAACLRLTAPFLLPTPHLRRYTALLYRPTNLTAPIFSLALAADGTTAAGTTSFSEDVALPAGPYRLEIATANVHGDGAKSSMTAEFTVGAMPAGLGGRVAGCGEEHTVAYGC